MELQAVLVLCGVGVIVVAVLLLMGLFSASGTSYEEAIAQQRKATTELLALAENKNKPKKSNKKANKKLAKKEKNKDNTGLATGSELESEAPAESGVDDDVVPASKPHVEFCPPVVVDVPRDSPPNIKIRKRGKDPKVKPILLNKEDPSCINDPNMLPSPTTTVSNRFEEMHPKDEFELMQSSLTTEKLPEKKEEVVEKKEKKESKVVKGGKAAVKPAQLPEPVKEEAVRERHNSGDVPKEQRKGKKVEKKGNEEVAEVIREEVVPPLNAPQPSELTTEKLLKQALTSSSAPSVASSPPATKNKKKKPEPNIVTLMAGDGGAGVNVGELVRVVREAPLSRTEIQILTDALLNKHHDPLPEHSEWTEGPNDPIQKLKKQLAEKEKALADEVEASQALHAKLKELRATLNTERGRAAAAGRAAEQAAATARAELHTLQARLQRLHDDNRALQQDHHLLQSKLNAEGEAQAQRVQMEMHIQRLTENEAQLVSQLNALQAEVGALQAERAARAMELSQARCDAASVRDALMLAQQHHADLAQQLQDANRVCGEYAEQLAQQDLKFSQERHTATTEHQAEVQRLTSRAQTAENNIEKLREEVEKQKQQLSNELASLKEQLKARESELAELKQMKVVPAQNGLPPTNASDQHKAAELAKVESVVESLRSELANAQSSSKEQREQLARLQEQLSQYQQKNNELRIKNWKIMEALQSAEKSLQSKTASALPAQDSLHEAISKAQEAQYSEVANVLRGACPVAAPNSVAGREWLLSFANNLKKELEKRETERKLYEKKTSIPQTTTAPTTDSRVNELITKNEQLQSVVDNYKKIINDTEGVLSQLQQNVTLEERRWAEQLAEKQREIDDLRSAVMQMQKKIDNLQAELERVRSANHNHSFTESERHAEERLMAGLSDKCGIDVCNGPLQVGLEEK
ncbi:ribosome-binding protein 1 isoform X2 [Galleria mellonella]|uniref:Ribosome-binding protein 1 isoform X2 n=1 Tax=Galleria mellonella TaxID=7137 RepID=A0A6J1WXF8_GALME|nr:ribosome-binding protein 1 isoform X2 [Galleria mellonella]